MVYSCYIRDLHLGFVFQVDKEKERPTPLIKEEWYPLFGSSPWLSPQHNFIQQSLDSDSAQVQTLFAACRRFAMVRISDNGPGWK